jgi:hypothetical protein
MMLGKQGITAHLLDAGIAPVYQQKNHGLFVPVSCTDHDNTAFADTALTPQVQGWFANTVCVRLLYVTWFAMVSCTEPLRSQRRGGLEASLPQCVEFLAEQPCVPRSQCLSVLTPLQIQEWFACVANCNSTTLVPYHFILCHRAFYRYIYVLCV